MICCCCCNDFEYINLPDVSNKIPKLQSPFLNKCPFFLCFLGTSLELTFSTVLKRIFLKSVCAVETVQRINVRHLETLDQSPCAAWATRVKLDDESWTTWTCWKIRGGCEQSN